MWSHIGLWGKGLWGTNGGSEALLTNIAVALALALTGQAPMHSIPC